LQKVLAALGLGSRRDMEDLIRAGRLTVNDATAALGTRVGPRDRICLDGRELRHGRPTPPRVLIYHKPEGEIVSRDDPERRPSVFDHLPPAPGGRWLNIGRLDFNTSGLLLFTTSGDLANRFAHPRFELDREYAVRTRGEVTAAQQTQLARGVELEDGEARVESLASGGGTGANRWYRVVLREGRHRIVRRLFEAVGHPVSRLIRVRFGPVSLPPRLRQGQARELDPAEVTALLQALGEAPAAAVTRPADRPVKRGKPGPRPRSSQARRGKEPEKPLPRSRGSGRPPPRGGRAR
jgi:23S rRNA pseudouridine2605 synthase